MVDLLDRLPASVDPWVLPAGVLDRVGDVATSQGVVAVVDQVDAPWPTPGTAPFVVVLAELQIPGNVGTLVRAAAAAGAGAVICAGGADPTSPKVVRASAGAVFGIDVIGVAHPFDVVTRLQADGYRMAAAVVDGASPTTRPISAGPIAVVLGSEAHGLPGDVSCERRPAGHHRHGRPHRVAQRGHGGHRAVLRGAAPGPLGPVGTGAGPPLRSGQPVGAAAAQVSGRDFRPFQALT